MVRGDVHQVLLPKGTGHVQHGRRLAVIVRNDELLMLSTVTICPTSTSAPAASFHPTIAVDDRTTSVLCEMVTTIDVRRLGPRVAHLSLDEIREVDDALRIVLDLRD